MGSLYGYLMKMGQHHKTWKERWFVMQNGHLAYYKSKEMDVPARSCSRIQPSPQRASESLSYTALFNNYTVYFKFDGVDTQKPAGASSMQYLVLFNITQQGANIAPFGLGPKKKKGHHSSLSDRRPFSILSE